MMYASLSSVVGGLDKNVLSKQIIEHCGLTLGDADSGENTRCTEINMILE